MSLKWYDDGEFSALSKELVPDTGKCESVAGEMLRAAGRISYRFYNDGELAVPPNLDDLIDTAAEDYVDEEFDEIVGGRRLNSYEESDAYQEAWHNARTRAKELVEEDERYWDTDQLRAWSTAHYLMTKGNGDVRNLVSHIVSYGSTMSDSEYSDYVHALCDAVKEDVKQNPTLRNIPTEDMFDHMGEGPTGEHMAGEFDDRAILDHRASNGYYKFEWGKDLLGNDVRHYEVDKDERGFYPDGVHENGTPYDDNGLDAWGEDEYGLTPESDETDILAARSIYDAVCRDIEQASESERAARAEEYQRADQARRELTERADRWCQDHLGRDGYRMDEEDGILRDREGYDEDGYDKRGYDRNGRDIDGWTEDGYRRDENGVERDAGGYDRAGYDEDGYDIEGYDFDGYDADGYDERGYDADGYDRDGFDERGYDRSGNSEDDVIEAMSPSDESTQSKGRGFLGRMSDFMGGGFGSQKSSNPFGGDATVSGGKGHEGKPMVDGYEYINKNGKRVHVDSYKNPRYKGPRR